MRVRLFFLFIAILCISDLPAKELYFRHITMYEGVSQPSAISIYEDNKGRMWFGNDNLNVYDGSSVRTYRLSAYLDNVHDNNIHMICSNRESIFYILADRKLILFDDKEEKFTDTGISARCLYYRDNALYYASGNSVFRYDTERNEGINIITLPENEAYIRTIYAHGDSWLIGTSSGLFCYKENTLQTLLHGETITCLFVDESKRIWAGTSENGVRVCNNENWEILSAGKNEKKIIGDRIRCINQDENGNIWIGTFSGITVMDSTLRQSNHYFHNEQENWSLRHSSVYAITRDRQGGMWVGTYYGGMSYYNPDTEHFLYYDASKYDSDKLNGFLFGQMTEDLKGNIYIATESGGLNSINKYTRKIKRYENIPVNTAKSVWYDNQHDILYIGTFTYGLLAFYPSSGHFIPIGDHILTTENQRIITHLLPWNDYLIVATQGGLFKLHRNAGNLSPFFEDPETQQKTESIFSHIHIDHNERLWMGSSTETIQYLSLPDNSLHKVEKLNDLIGRKPVLFIDSDANNCIYFTVPGLGVIEYNSENDSIKTYSQEKGHLFTNQIYKAVVTHPGVLFITSSQGFTLLHMEKGENIYTRLIDYSPMQSFNANCGVYYSEDTGEIFLGGIEGIITVKEERLFSKEFPYNIAFSSLTINNFPVSPTTDPTILQQTIGYTHSLVLPHNKNNVSIAFTSTNYRHSDKNIFEYRLEGLDNQWTKTSYRTITYTSLSPGKYKLIVREAGKEWKEILLHIHVRPPFYASTFAWCIYILLLGLFLFWLIRFNQSRTILKASLEMEQREKERIEELNQMKLRFYVNISHELRTPLTLMISQLELIIQNSDISNSFRNRIKKISRYAAQMQQLVTEILDFRRMELNKMPFKASRQNIVSFSRNVFDAFRDFAEIHKIDFRFYTTDDDISLWFDPSQIQKALYNVLSNAFKYTPEGGSIMVQICLKDEFVEIHITDTGYGIEEKDLEHIFDRFYQADNPESTSSTGTGIGLSLTREIMNQHHGGLTVTSRVGEGSTFTICLPLGDKHLDASQKSSVPQTINPLSVVDVSLREEETEVVALANNENKENDYTVLIVEDNKELCHLLEEAFTPMYTVLIAHDGLEGLQAAEKEVPDLIVSDIMMPRLSGIEMCRQLKQKPDTSHIPIILLTARTDMDSAMEGLRSGANDYLIKPFNMEILLLKCNNIIHIQQEKQRRFHSEVQTKPIELATNRMDQELLDKSVKIIESNLENQDFNIEMWCREIAIGRTRLAEKIKRLSGLTLNDFILQIKLRKCASLLIEKDITISEIAWLSGFSSAGYMGKCFKEYFGMTPMQYRNSKKL